MNDNPKPPAVKELELERGRPFDHHFKVPAQTYQLQLDTRGIDGEILPGEKTVVHLNNRTRLRDGDIAVWTTVNGTLVYWTGRAAPYDPRSFLTLEETLLTVRWCSNGAI